MVRSVAEHGHTKAFSYALIREIKDHVTVDHGFNEEWVEGLVEHWPLGSAYRTLTHYHTEDHELMDIKRGGDDGSRTSNYGAVASKHS